ncbi:MAG: hypothetical protein F7B17_09085 [Desulfurococcales archaeon]|nr:hypothetical protein [Desulfurococcales archaeon]
MGASRLFIPAVIALLLVASTVSALTPAAQEGPVIAVDLSHGQPDEGVETIIASCGGCRWILILLDEAQREAVRAEVLEAADEVRLGGLTPENLSDVDVLLIGQATSLLSADEVEAIRQWASQGRKAVWVAGDSDYPAQGSEIAQQAVNQVLEALGSSIRIDYVSVEDYTSNAGRSYRVVGVVDPDPPFTFLKQGLPNGGKVLFHGPGALYAIGANGEPVNPLKKPELKPEGVYVIVRTTEDSKSVEHQTAETGGLSAVYYDPLNDEVNTGPFPLMMAEIKGNLMIVASSETMYGGYEPMTAPEYYGVALDGPEFVGRVVSTMAAFTTGLFIVSVVEREVTVTVTQTEKQVLTETVTETVKETVTRENTVTMTVTTTTTVSGGPGTTTLVVAGIIIAAAIVAAALILRR